MAKFIVKRAKTDFGIKLWYFTLKADNGEILLTSELYNSKQGAMKGVEAIKKAVIAVLSNENDLEFAAHFPNGV